MKRILFPILLLVALIPLSTAATQRLPSPLFFAKPTPIPNPNPDARDQVESAIHQAIQAHQEDVLAFLIHPVQIIDLKFSADGQWSSALLVNSDPHTGEGLPSEPGLALAQRVGETWRVTLQTDADWLSVLEAVPPDLMPPDFKSYWLEMYHAEQVAMPTAPLTGYLLPWEGGQTKYLSQSVGHDKYTPSGTAHYAFDFYVHDTMWDIYAAKAGTVWYFKYDVPTCTDLHCDQPLGNFIVLEDTTTNPTSYQLYLHLAYDSIPTALRQRGAVVRQGQFLGVADNTGASYGHHLHFQVHLNPNSYWGQSVDIVFQDVDINGGRPRVSPYDDAYCQPQDVCQGFRPNYTSGNAIHSDLTPPEGDILEPLNGITLLTDTLHLEGWATDTGTGLNSAQFIASYAGAWQDVGGVYTSTLFSADWNLCQDNVPDGPVSLALRLRDNDGNLTTNLPGLRHFTKNYACPPPPPTCTPTDNQVALFAATDYGGACALFAAGTYTNTAGLGDNNVTSIQVGAGVQATLYMNANLQGRGETFAGDDADLGDNRIGNGTVSSLRVQPRSSAPAVPSPQWPPHGQIYTGTLSLSLAWEDNGGATQFQTRLREGLTTTLTSTWLSEPIWHLGSLNPGSYAWQVRAKNSYTQSAWSAPSTLTVTLESPPPPSPLTVTAPFTDSMEITPTQWSHTNYWDLTLDANHTPNGKISWTYDTNSKQGYDTGAPNSGDLTSPPVSIPASGEYFLRFWYLYQTEGPGTHWDQRWVQISKDGGPFTNTLQLSDDPAEVWLQGPVLSLADYAGSTIRVRFHFETLDKEFNTGKGWYIDDFSITAQPPAACTPTHEPNDSPAQATAIAYNTSLNAQICPEGDVDYYKFSGTAGNQIGIATQAQSAGSPLDTYLYLLDGDGGSVLAENDDQIPYQRTDSFLSYRLTRSGEYYLKVRAWNHPSIGGSAYTYTLRLSKDGIDPTASFLAPVSNSLLPTEPFSLTVSASDPQSGVSHVEFLWHSGDWQSADWILLEEDWDGSDGWSASFDPSALPDQTGIAFYAKVYDWAGNWIGVGAWNLSKPASLVYLPFIPK